MTEKMFNKDTPPAAEKAPPPTREAMRHDPDRPLSEYIEDEGQDRLRIPKTEYPDGLDLQWVTHSIFGQLQRQHRASFERKGWEPVLASDFDGKYGKQFLPDNVDPNTEVEVDGLVLMARSKKWSEHAKRADHKEAVNRVSIKEMQLKGGDLRGVTMGAQEPQAVRSNYIKKSIDTIQVPLDDN